MGGLLALVNPISTILDKVLPDKAQNDAAKANLLELQVKGDLDNALAQLQVDNTEATSKSFWVAGWRPAVGWTCAASFAYAFFLQPLLQFALVAFKVNFDVSKLPVLDISEMLPVLLGMLGLAAARTVEKVNGVNSGH